MAEPTMAELVKIMASHEERDEERFKALDDAAHDAKNTRDRTLLLVEQMSADLSGTKAEPGIFEQVRSNTECIKEIKAAHDQEIKERKQAQLRMWGAIGAVGLVVLTALLNYLFARHA